MTTYLVKLKSSLDDFIQSGDISGLSDFLAGLTSESTGLSSEHISFLKSQYNPAWWQPITTDRLNVRRRDSRDAAFVQECFLNAEFATRFMRDFVPANISRLTELEQDLKNEFLAPPTVQKNAVWVVSRGSESLGLIALANIDNRHRSAELLVGFPLHRPLLSVKATIYLIDHLFRCLNIEKLVSHVFSDNQHSQHSTESLSFAREVFLRAEFRSRDGTRLDLYRNGLLKDDFYSVQLVRKILSLL